jgi:hypothetical protein
VLASCTRTKGARLPGVWAVLIQPPLEVWGHGVSFRD